MYLYKTTKHKVFISFYHHDDEKYKEKLLDSWGETIIDKSVSEGEYDPDNSDEYIKRLIREDKISDSSIVVVLVGPNTKRRKHVDWEIYAGLRPSINGNAGLVGIALPELEFPYYYSDLPGRLSDNIQSKYAAFYEWSYAMKNFDDIIQEAFDNRISKKHLIDNSRPQMKRNL